MSARLSPGVDLTDFTRIFENVSAAGVMPTLIMPWPRRDTEPTRILNPALTRVSQKQYGGHVVAFLIFASMGGTMPVNGSCEGGSGK